MSNQARIFLCTKLLENLVLVKYIISVAVALKKKSEILVNLFDVVKKPVIENESLLY